MSTNLEFPEEVKPCSGFHLLGMQVQCQDKDRNDDRGDDLQCNSCHCWRAVANKEQDCQVILSVKGHSSATHPSSHFRTNQALKKWHFSFPLKPTLVKGKQHLKKNLRTLDYRCWFLKQDLEIRNATQLPNKR